MLDMVIATYIDVDGNDDASVPVMVSHRLKYFICTNRWLGTYYQRSNEIDYSELNMNEIVAMNLIKDTMYMAMIVGLPPLLVGLVVGLLVTIFQTTTSLQEQTLTFIPKVVATMATVIFLRAMDD